MDTERSWRNALSRRARAKKRAWRLGLDVELNNLQDEHAELQRKADKLDEAVKATRCMLLLLSDFLKK